MKRQMNEKKFLKFMAIAIIAVPLVGFVIMSLWNNVLVPVVAVKTINLWQALGLFLLSKILFGGFNGRGPRNRMWANNMKEKWQQMSPEDRKNFRANWKGRCRPGTETTPEESIP